MSVNPPPQQFASNRQFEIAILGPGALGSIIGAHLARAGHSVAMLARGRRADFISTHGLTLTGLAEFSIPVTVLTDPASLRSADVLIVATKTPGTEAALARLRHVDMGIAFSVQNGTMKNDLLASVFTADRVLGSLADTSGEMLADGRVLFTRNVNILLGELSGALSQRARDVAATIDSSGVRAMAVPDILSLEWSKYVTWVGMFALSVITRSVTWRYMVDEDAALVLVRVTREMGRLAAALGIELTDEANMPAATLCRGTEAEAVSEVVKRGRVFESRSPQHRMSALQDLLAGRPLEVHETLGYALRKGAAAGVPMRLLDGFYRVISAAERIREAGAAAEGT
ncbi:MAG TPA: 2-dehydropantoate 2-reductase [Steroidobacteraceae bacterium]|nr:2-dehydropantoate 2-reductase [Steroidobacteraceae bacterium]